MRAAPASRGRQEPREGVDQVQAAPVARQPLRIKDVDSRDYGDRGRQVGVPASDDEVDCGLRRVCSDVRDRRQGHQEIADAFEAEEQDPLRRRRTPAPAEGARHGGEPVQGAVRYRHQHALAWIVDVKPGLGDDGRRH